MVKIITEYGYCYGVLNAVRILEESAKRKSKVYLTHTLIHNEEENRRLLKENHAVFYAPGMPLDSDTAVVFSREVRSQHVLLHVGCRYGR
jgi:4-hydroxy-3-methylbut-2-enyl diphosphate reductase IspH